MHNRVRPVWTGRHWPAGNCPPSWAWTYMKLGICISQSISININRSLHTSRAHPNRSSGSTIQTQNYNCKQCKSNWNEDDVRRHDDLFDRSSDSPRAPTCESYSPLRKLVVTQGQASSSSPLYDHAPSWHTIEAATSLPLLTTTLGSSRQRLAV